MPRRSRSCSNTCNVSTCYFFFASKSITMTKRKANTCTMKFSFLVHETKIPEGLEEKKIKIKHDNPCYIKINNINFKPCMAVKPHIGRTINLRKFCKFFSELCILSAHDQKKKKDNRSPASS